LAFCLSVRGFARLTIRETLTFRAFRAMRDRTGNLPSLPAVFPDTMAPVVRTAPDGERELLMMRWGFPPAPNLGTAPVANVRNLKSPYWRRWLKAEWRCLVPDFILRMDRY
jgi:putative SOS response-associated peptidase YedK